MVVSAHEFRGSSYLPICLSNVGYNVFPVSSGLLQIQEKLLTFQSVPVFTQSWKEVECTNLFTELKTKSLLKIYFAIYWLFSFLVL